jgi:hypothetical protein
LLAIQQKHAALHSKTAGLWQSDQHLAVFAKMSALLQEAFEEVRVMSGQLRMESQAVRAKATARTINAMFAWMASLMASWTCSTVSLGKPPALSFV